MESVIVPTLKSIEDVSHGSYIFYEPGTVQWIVKVNTTIPSVSVYRRTPGQAVESLELFNGNLQNFDAAEFVQVLVRGCYVFDIVVYKNKYFIVDLLYDSNLNLENVSYRDRLKRLNQLFNRVPIKFAIKSAQTNLDSYKDFKDHLIVKDAESSLKYNVDYKYTTAIKSYLIVGRVNSTVPPPANGEQVSKEITSKVSYLVADCKSQIFGVFTLSPSSMESAHLERKKRSIDAQSTKRYTFATTRVTSDPKYESIDYFDTPSVGNFVVKTPSKTDLCKMQLKRIVCDERENFTIDTMPLCSYKISKRGRTNADHVTHLLNNLHLLTFGENVELYNHYMTMLIDLHSVLSDECAPFVNATKRPASGISNGHSNATDEPSTKKSKNSHSHVESSDDDDHRSDAMDSDVSGLNEAVDNRI